MYDKIVIVSNHKYLEEALKASIEFQAASIATNQTFKYCYNDLFIIDEISSTYGFSNIIKIGRSCSDQIVKPFALKELIALIGQKQLQRVFYIDEVEFYPHVKLLKKLDMEIAITKRESELLCFLLINVGKFFESKSLLSAIWGYNANIETNTLDTHIYELRKSLEKVGIKDLIKCKNSHFYIDCIGPAIIKK